jgi:hypothetical protein
VGWVTSALAGPMMPSNKVSAHTAGPNVSCLRVRMS